MNVWQNCDHAYYLLVLFPMIFTLQIAYPLPIQVSYNKSYFGQLYQI